MLFQAYLFKMNVSSHHCSPFYVIDDLFVLVMKNRSVCWQVRRCWRLATTAKSQLIHTLSPCYVYFDIQVGFFKVQLFSLDFILYYTGFACFFQIFQGILLFRYSQSYFFHIKLIFKSSCKGHLTLILRPRMSFTTSGLCDHVCFNPFGKIQTAKTADFFSGNRQMTIYLSKSVHNILTNSQQIKNTKIRRHGQYVEPHQDRLP